MFRYWYCFIFLVTALFSSVELYAADESEQTPAAATEDLNTDEPQSSAPSKPQVITKKIPVKMPLPKTHWQQDDIKRLADEDEIRPLIAGEDSFIALLSEQDTPMVRGVAILLADWGLNSTENQALNNLRYSLNEYGWVTLAANVAEPYENNSALDEAMAKKMLSRPDIGAEVFPEQAQQDYRLKMQMRLSALMDEASNYQGIVMVIAQGVSAGFVVELLSADSNTVTPPEMLVLMQPYLPSKKANKNLAKKIASLDVAILDIWSGFDNRWALSTVDLRKKYARKLLSLHYRQRQLFARQGWQQRDLKLTKEIVGYLAYLGW